jgi:transcriptional regulator with XRE-family HTH domain
MQQFNWLHLSKYWATPATNLQYCYGSKKKDTNILGIYFIIMHFLGKNLRYLRKQSSRTQSEIASLIQKGQTTIGNWENGISEPSLSELMIISNYFDIPLDTLLKTDLAETQSPTVQRQGGIARPYNHSDAVSVAEEPASNLAYVLKEIKEMQLKIEQLSARLPPE